jgi:hypothetical protein
MQEQQITPDTQILPIVMAVPHLDCAWCLKERGIAAGEGSHGMCQRHKALMLAQHARLKAARAAQKQGGGTCF